MKQQIAITVVSNGPKPRLFKINRSNAAYLSGSNRIPPKPFLLWDIPSDRYGRLRYNNIIHHEAGNILGIKSDYIIYYSTKHTCHYFLDKSMHNLHGKAISII